VQTNPIMLPILGMSDMAMTAGPMHASDNTSRLPAQGSRKPRAERRDARSRLPASLTMPLATVGTHLRREGVLRRGGLWGMMGAVLEDGLQFIQGWEADFFENIAAGFQFGTYTTEKFGQSVLCVAGRHLIASLIFPPKPLLFSAGALLAAAAAMALISLPR
jgi:hypothetical protein